MSPNSPGLPRRAANIFINYRREDTAGHAGRLFDRLNGRFPGRVFMDIDTIEPGTDFVEILEQAVGCCEVLIVMIGRDWVNLQDESGRRRLDNPNDFVRLEIATALTRNIRIIPVLVDAAAMPRPEDLPADLGKLTRRNAIELSNGRWAFDADRLIQTIEGVLQEKAPSALLSAVTPASSPPPAPPPPVPAETKQTRLRAWWLPAVLVLLPLVGLAGWRLGRPAPQPAQPPVSSPDPRQPPDQTAQTVETAEPGQPADQPVSAQSPSAAAAEQSLGKPEVGSEEKPVQKEEPARKEPVQAQAAGKTHPAAEDAPAAEPGAARYGPDACKKGYVWREARAGDHVCVTPEIKQQTAEENRLASSRRNPGFDTCLPGYVFRNAFEGDRVCVTREARDQASLDNSRADERKKNWLQRQTEKAKDRWGRDPSNP